VPVPVPVPAPRGINDANAAAFTEFTLLRQQPRFSELTDLVCLKGDAGFGGGAIVRGELVEGRSGFAFEPGHIRVDGVDVVVFQPGSSLRLTQCVPCRAVLCGEEGEVVHQKRFKWSSSTHQINFSRPELTEYNWSQ